MNRIFILVLILIACKLQAQENNKNISGWKDRFHSFNTVQLLNGSTTTSFAINTVNGFQFVKFFGGIGTGFDYYYHISVPLFAEARLDLLKRKGRLQLFGNGGLNFPFSSQEKNFETAPGNYKVASLYGTGIDYLVTAKKEAFILGVAFSNKQVVQMMDNNVWNPSLNRVENIPVRNKYSLNRLAIRVGWMF